MVESQVLLSAVRLVSKLSCIKLEGNAANPPTNADSCGEENVPMRTRLLIVSVIVVGLVCVWLATRGSKTSEHARTDKPPEPRQAETASSKPSGPLADAVELVASAKVSGASGSALDQLRARLRSMTREAASRAIQQLLDRGDDSPTDLAFKLGADGSLVQAPTFRLFLLDQLLQVDRETAAAYAAKILAVHGSPDEWAVGLRNYALVRTNSEARAYLLGKFRELIHYEPWCSEPSVGFLEAFDVPVSQGGIELLPDLTELVRRTNSQAVAHAAYLALDRLTIADPAAVLGELQRQPAAMQGRELTRANLFARADVFDPRQRGILENYLTDPAISPAELETFAGLYPNANYMVSHNLLTRTQTPNRDSLVRRDQLALQTVQQWLADPRFERIRPQLETIQGRLASFVQQAGAATRK